MEPPEPAANIDSFLQWAADLGISDSSSSENQSGDANCPTSCLGRTLFVSHFPDSGGRGLAAARDIRKGELILRVPKRALITSESLMMSDENLCAVMKAHSSLSSTQILASALLNEVNKAKESYWYHYLKQIPRAYHTLASFSQFEIQAFQINDAIWAAENATEKAKSEWEEAKVLLVELKLKPVLVTFKAWLWADATISSRTMHLPSDGAGCLCPVGDFFNYDAPGEERCDPEIAGTYGVISKSEQRLTDAGYEEDSVAYCFYARKNYSAKEQVLLSYGMYTNLELLEHYGFLLDDNLNDKAFIPLEPDMYSLSSCSKDLLYINHEGKPSFALFSVLRLWATPPNKRRSVGHLAYSGHLLSAENEVTVMEWLAKKCHDVLDNLPTTIEQDQLLLGLMQTDNSPLTCNGELTSLLKSNGMTSCIDPYICRKGTSVVSRWKLAVLWRLRYKKTLSDCVTHCTERIRCFKLGNGSTNFY